MMTQILSVSPLYFVAIIVLVALSAFFSASEMSFSSTNKLRLENMVDDEVKGAALALKVAEKFDDALSAILIGNNLELYRLCCGDFDCRRGMDLGCNFDHYSAGYYLRGNHAQDCGKEECQ